MPIRVRLALWYAGVLALVLVVLGASVYFVMARHMSSVLHERVAARSDHLVDFMTAANVLPHAPHAFGLPPAELLEGPDAYVQVLDEDGAALVGSQALAGAAAPVPANAMGAARSGATTFFTLRLDGQAYLARLAPVLDPGPAPAGFVLVAMRGAEEASTLARLRSVLVIGGIMGVLMAGLVGWSVAGRALRPVAEMIETARAIALSRGFSRRLPTSEQRDELARLARAFNEMLASLEAAYAAQQRFTADASHELRAPLTTIRANLDLLSRPGGLPPEERRTAIEASRKEAERMSRLVDDLLSLARADAGQTVQKSEVQLDALMLEAHEHALSAGRGVKVSLGELRPLTVLGDPDRLKQLLLILVDNALRYAPAGSAITLSVVSEGPWAVACVSDTGPGISAKDLPHIFERFYRGEEARRVDPSGTGLGLAIARWIVDQHGGKIAVQSEPGAGSAFRVCLPCASGAPSGSVVAERPEEASRF